MISKTLPSSGIKEQSTENIGGMWINTSTVWYQTDVMQLFSFLRKKTHMSYLHVAPKEVFYGNSTKVILKMKSPLILLVYFFQRMSGLSLTDLYCVRAWRLIKVNLLPLGWSLHSALWHDDMAWSPTTLKHTTPTLPQLHGKLLSFWTNLWGMIEIGASKNAPINPQHA